MQRIATCSACRCNHAVNRQVAVASRARPDDLEIVGQAGGPWIVAVFTDYVFGAPELVRYSLAVAPSALLLIGAALVWSGFGGLRTMRGPA